MGIIIIAALGLLAFCLLLHTKNTTGMERAITTVKNAKIHAITKENIDQ